MSYFQFHDENAWPCNGKSYDGWWGHDTLPKLNYEDSRELHDYILHIAAQVGVAALIMQMDGGWMWRQIWDTVRNIIISFWKRFRRAVNGANPEAVDFGRTLRRPERHGWVADEWDTVMNYDAFMEPVTWFLTGMEKHSDDFTTGNILESLQNFIGAMKHHMASFLTPSLQCCHE